jgi:hypothetical protein
MAKAGRPRKGSARLPGWFNIEKYQDTQDYGAGDWYVQLAFRKVLFDSHKSDGKFRGHEDKNSLSKLAELLTDDPHITEERIDNSIGHHIEGRGLSQYFVNRTLDNVFRAWPFVRKLIHLDVMALRAAIDREYRQVAAETGGNGGLSDTPSFKPLASDQKARLYAFLAKPVEYAGCDVVFVNNFAPEKVLIDSFRDFLRKRKPEHRNPISPINKSRNFNDWYKCGILPYLDLKLWELMKGESFHWGAFAEALENLTGFRYGSESTLMKAVKSCEKLLMDDKALAMLQLQAEREESGAVKKSGKLNIRNSEK